MLVSSSLLVRHSFIFKNVPHLLRPTQQDLNANINFESVLVCFYVAVIKTFYPGKERVYFILHFQVTVSSLSKARAGTSRQELKERPWENSVYWLALFSFRSSCLGIVLSTGLFYINQKLRKCLSHMTTGQSDLGSSSAEISSSQVTL